MYKIGEYIMYGGTVMRIASIGGLSFAPDDRRYYALEDAVAANASTTYVPTDNEKLVASMRPLMSEGEIRAVLSSYPDIPALEWRSDNKARNEAFRAITESQDMRSILGMIKAIAEMSAARQAEGKKSYITDLNALAKAKKILVAEISFVMGLTDAEAQELLPAMPCGGTV